MQYQDTGHLFEEEVLGTATVKFRGYQTRWAAIGEVRKHQPSRKSATLSAIEKEFARRGLEVECCTAVGTSMDYFHGADALFVWKGIVVTLDVTINPNKDGTKADILLIPEDLKDIPSLTSRIAREMLTKARRQYA